MGAMADRNVLAPRGLIAEPSSLRLEYAALSAGGRTHLGWLTVGWPDEGLGLELEAERFEQGGRRRETLSAQYSLTGNVFSDLAPAVSIGVRDLLNRGRERRAFFLAATKTFGLSRTQERLLREWKLHVGYGSSRLNGPYVGIQGRFTLGFTVHAEYVARRVNGSVAWPVGRYLNLNAYSLDGDLFYGATFTVTK